MEANVRRAADRPYANSDLYTPPGVILRDIILARQSRAGEVEPVKDQAGLGPGQPIGGELEAGATS
jgi:hypothetical protein